MCVDAADYVTLTLACQLIMNKPGSQPRLRALLTRIVTLGTCEMDAAALKAEAGASADTDKWKPYGATDIELHCSDGVFKAGELAVYTPLGFDGMQLFRD
jgi:hypothetical protein